MNNLIYKDNMTQTEVDLFAEQIDALEKAYLESELFESLMSHAEEWCDDSSDI